MIELNESAFSIGWFKANIETFESMYFKDGTSIKNITVRNKTSRKVEREAEKYENGENAGKIDLRIAAWKMGRLNDNLRVVRTKNGNILNGYGKEISGLDDYIQNIDCKSIKKLIDNGDYETAFSELAKNSPANFGTVYIITLMHFISKGEIPIYDKFAHKAAKALFANVNVNKIYVSAPPDKDKIDDVFALLNEYIWLLEKLFGTSKIDRQTDRALWVYGHAGENFDGTIKLNDE